ncbi:hypothetical protein EQG49_10485 [Periweissella cryptocerci]|uniref:Uncharacterized protein n=1 Tax=Periweissella cryptocerci TaxID=2506420 RepID=A0A4P6YVG5_9LACO|nr:hypothetical protein [Periweissella cryptocerci]QBO36839.1 hypothetical protein EQG49_10485 [Periweissella cryptocerci]
MNLLKKVMTLVTDNKYYDWTTKYQATNGIVITKQPQKRHHAVCLQASHQLWAIANEPTNDLPAYMGLTEMQQWLNERGLIIVSEHPTHWWAGMVHSLNNGDVAQAHELCNILEYLNLTKP